VQDLVSVTVGAAPSGLAPLQLAGLIISIVLALVNILWTSRLARHSRRRSVEDEFWFRKVIAPGVIDKSLEFTGKWTAQLSKAQALSGPAAKRQIAECKSEGAAIISGCLCLKLYGNESYKEASTLIDEMIDAVTECLYGVTSSAISPLDADKLVRDKRESMHLTLVRLLEGMKKLQKTF
jgi:hypothetical protein